MSNSDLITLLGIFVAVLIAVIPTNKYFLLKWNLSSKGLWCFSVLSVVILLILINSADILDQYSPGIKQYFFYNNKYLPTGNVWALIYAVYIIWLLVFKQVSAKFSKNKPNEVCDYFHELLSNERYIDVIQLVDNHGVLDNLGDELNKKIFDTFVQYNKFIRFIAKTKTKTFINSIFAHGQDHHYYAEFVKELLTSHALTSELYSYLKRNAAQNYDFTEYPILYKLLISNQNDRDGELLRLICELSLNELKNNAIKHELLNNIGNQDNKLELMKYKIYVTSIFLQIKAKNLVDSNSTQNIWLQYYEAFISEVIDIGEDETDQSVRICIFEEIIYHFLSSLSYTFKQINSESYIQLLKDCFLISIKVIILISKGSVLSNNKRTRLIEDLLAAIISSQNNEFFKDNFDKICDCYESFGITRDASSFIILDVLRNMRCEVTSYNIHIKNKLEQFLTIDTQKYDTYCERFFKNSFEELQLKNSRSRIALSIKSALLKELDIKYDYLFYPQSFRFCDSIESLLEDEKKNRDKSFKNYWSFVELYRVENKISKNKTFYEKVISYDKFQIPFSMWWLRSQYNIRGISEFYSEEDLSQDILGQIKDANPNMSEEILNYIGKSYLQTANNYIFESSFENDYFICYYKFNFVNTKIEDLISGKTRTSPSSWVMIKVGIKITGDFVEIALFDLNFESFKFIFNRYEIPNYIIKRIIFAIEKLT